MKFWLLLNILFFSVRSDFADVDSLKNLLDRSEGKKKIQIMITLMEKIERDEPRTVLRLGDEALLLLKNRADKEIEAEIHSRKGWAYTYLNNTDSARIEAAITGRISESTGFLKGKIMESFLLARAARMEGLNDEAMKHLDLAEEFNESLQDKEYEVKLLNERGSVYRRLSQYNEALVVHTKAFEILQEKHTEEELRSTLTYLGIINDLLGRYDEALKYHHKSLEISQRLKDTRAVAGAFHNIGVLNQKIDRYEEALEYYNRALEYWKQLNNNDGLASTLNSIGAVHELKEDFNEALNYYQQAYRIWENSSTKYTLSIALHNIGTSYYNLKNYNQAIDWLQKALEMRQQIQDRQGIANTLLIMASVYDKLGKAETAINTAKEAVKIAEETKSWSSIKHAHNVLGEIYESNRYYKEALIEYKKYFAAHDSMFSSERQQSISELQEKFKSDEQRQKIALLERDNQIQNLYKSILIAGIILLFLFIILLFNRYRIKQRAHRALKQLHESEVESANLRTQAAESKAAIIQVEVEQKNKELCAARELQLSMLPAVIPSVPGVSIAARMYTATEVGGDYYDFHKSENGALTIAIGDATGHGVRAGIMVTAVKSIFNLLAGEKDLIDILCRSTQSIRKMNFSNLFMAYGLLRLCNNTLEVAGAGMPHGYIYRGDTKEIETLSLKGLPLGIALGYEYTKSSVKLNRGDTVVIMSDGFPELFNKKKENLGYETIPVLIKETGDCSPEEIIDYFTDKAGKWLDGETQQDDMTFVVLKVE